MAEDLGKSREQMWEDLVNGRTKFHNVFHYPTETWGDVALIGWLIDGAALVTQRALLDSSYAPYVRAMRRICAEESVHLRHGEDLALELVSGTEEQREMFQDAVNRWWRPIMHFYGPPSNPDKDVLLHWGIKTRTNEDLRQEFSPRTSRSSGTSASPCPTRSSGGRSRTASGIGPTRGGTTSGRSSGATAR